MTRPAAVPRVWEVLSDTTRPEWMTAGFVAHTLDDDRMSSADVAPILDALVEGGLAQESGGSYRAVVDPETLGDQSERVVEALRS